MSLRREIENIYSFLGARPQKWQDILDSTFKNKKLEGTISINEKDKELAQDEVLYLVWEHFHDLLDQDQLYTLAYSGLLTKFYSPNGSRNSTKIIKLLQELHPSLTPSSTHAQRFINAWTKLFSSGEIEYKIGLSLEDFRRLGSYKCDGDSCFGIEGCNSHHPLLLYHYLPSFVIVLNNNKARCWGFVNPDSLDYIYLSNFYFYNIDNNKSFFVRVLEHVLEKGILVYSSVNIAIGVYTNGDAICVRPYNLESKSYKEVVYCAICECSSQYYICDSCTSGSRVACCECGAYMDENDLYCDDGNYFCEECWNQIFGYCDNCGDYFVWDYLHIVEDNYYCSRCFDDKFYTCDECKKIRQYADDEIEVYDNFDCDLCDDCYKFLMFVFPVKPSENTL